MNNSLEDNNLSQLIKLSSDSDIEIFDKNLNLKSKDLILKKCEAIKKKELKEIKKTSNMLSNLAKLSNSENIEQIKLTYNNLEHKINNINNIEEIIKYLNTHEINSKPIIKTIRYIKPQYEYIESYGN